VKFMIDLKTISANISSNDIGEHIYTELSNVLSLLMSKNFDIFALADKLNENPLGRELNV
jgi:hypothetical protein